MTWAGRVIRGLVKIVADLIKKLTEIGRKAIPVAILIVNALREVMANPIKGSIINFILDFVKKQIEGTKDDIAIDKLKAILEELLPKILEDFKATDAILAIEDPEERLRALLKLLKGNSEDANKIIFHGLGILFAQKLSEGELDWNKSATVMQAAYDHPEVLTVA